MHCSDSLRRTSLRAVLPVSIAVLASPAAASTSDLHDGTPVSVRLVGVINSEFTRTGQPLTFIVVRDVVSDRGDILIRRGASVAGVVTESRRAQWGFISRKPRFAFAFTVTSARDGQIVMLRASPVRLEGQRDPGVVLDKYARHHQVRWTSGGEVFQAYVDGSYQV